MSRLALIVLGMLDEAALRRLARVAALPGPEASSEELRHRLAAAPQVTLPLIFSSLSDRELKTICSALFGDEQFDLALQRCGVPNWQRRLSAREGPPSPDPEQRSPRPAPAPRPPERPDELAS